MNITSLHTTYNFSLQVALNCLLPRPMNLNRTQEERESELQSIIAELKAPKPHFETRPLTEEERAYWKAVEEKFDKKRRDDGWVSWTP